MAVDTLFLCFSDDYNTYDTTDGRELVADKELYEFMVKHEDIDRKNSRKPRRRDPPETIRFKEGAVWRQRKFLTMLAAAETDSFLHAPPLSETEYLLWLW